uniref:EB domain-containing protein n=1 Tax=Ascaris suum TaxID=6253 RepID=F1KUU7_ASCSU
MLFDAIFFNVYLSTTTRSSHVQANNSPYYCTTNNEVPCPPGYSCNEAQNQPGIYVCCMSRSSNSCPTNFTPSLNTAGREIYCTPNQPNVCPGYSMCLQSTRSSNTFLCCESINVLHMCPNNGQALLLPNGRVEECGKPGASCSQKGYTCQLSSALSTWICCTQPSEIAVCANERKTYFETEGQTFSCEPFAVPTGCPLYYDCSVSNTSGVFVCCQQALISTTPTAPLKIVMGCPIGWNPFQSEIDGSFRFCLNSFDMRCPIGFSCTQSTQSGIYMCCRLASTIRCAHGQSTLLVNNQPKLCYGTQQNSCPIGYSCSLSTKIGIYMCCSDYVAFQRSHFDVLKEIRCLSDSSMPAIQNDNIQYCIETNKFSSCPRGYLCSPSTVAGLSVCCKSSIELKIRELESSLDKACGTFGVIYRRNGRAVECTDDMSLCPEDFSCQPSLVNAKMYCCQELKCQTGLAFSEGRRCKHSRDCPKGYQCLQSKSTKDIRLCCTAVNALQIRCLERKTQLSAGKAIACTEDSHCADGYKCSRHTTSGEYMCCEGLPYPTRICPQNREPYHGEGNDELVFCSKKRQQSCPSGYFCKRAVNSRHHVCCSPIAFCPSRYVPLIDPETNQAKRCLSEASVSMPSSADCSPGYSCRQSSVPYLKVCCRAPSIGNHSGASVDDNNLERYTLDGRGQ